MKTIELVEAGNFVKFTYAGTGRAENTVDFKRKEDVSFRVIDDRHISISAKGNSNNKLGLYITADMQDDEVKVAGAPITTAAEAEAALVPLLFKAAGSSASPTGEFEVPEFDAAGMPLDTVAVMKVVRTGNGSGLEIIDSDGRRVI